MLPIPTTFDIAILLATAAKLTWPVTFAPVNDVNPAPFAVMLVTDKVFVLLLNVKLALAPNAFALLNWTCVLIPAAFVVNAYGSPLAYNKWSVLTLPAVTLPVTDKLLNVPTEVIFGWAFAVTVPAVDALPIKVPTTVPNTLPNTLPVNVPVTLPFKLPVKVVAFTLPAVILPVTDKLLNVPTLVILGCAFVVTVPAVTAKLALPLIFPIILVAVILPLTTTPLPVITNTLLFPPTLAVIFPPLVVTYRLLLPLLIPLVPLPGGNQDNDPDPSVLNTYPDPPPVMVILPTGPKSLKPVTVKLGIVTVSVVLSKVKLSLPPNAPSLLYWTVVFAPTGSPPPVKGCPLA